MTSLTLIRQFTEVSNTVRHRAWWRCGVVFYGTVLGDVIVFDPLTV